MKPLEIDGSPVSRETQAKLESYCQLLLKWQAKINLISPNTVDTAWERHFVDSAQLLPLLPPRPLTLYDLGSGAGFAGMVLATLNPALDVTLIESDGKKCAFLQTVSRETGVAVKIENTRIEGAAKALAAPDIVTARALAAVTQLLDYAHPWLSKKPDLRFVLPKGAAARQEIEAAQAAGWSFDCLETPSITDPSARILSLSNVRFS